MQRAMKKIDLREYERSEPIRLSVGARDALAHDELGLTITPVAGVESQYTLTPGSIVGAVETANMSVRIKPKIGIRQLMSIACYAIGKVTFQEREFEFPEASALPDALALVFGAAANRAFCRGLLHGYRSEDEALYTVRGRIRFGDHIRRRPGMPLPVEVSYDEFTDDILPNRLVKAAAFRLGRLRLGSRQAYNRLAWVAGKLSGVGLAEFPPNAVPEVQFDRLSEHYRGVVTLAELILRHGAFEARRGNVRASGFLMDMNRVYQEFVTVALRQSLKVSVRQFGERDISSLDVEGAVGLTPDLTWWDGGTCMFVGDAKYKAIDAKARNADLFQLLAYATATKLPGGLLVYAQGESDQTYTVQHSGKQLEIAVLDLSESLEDILARVDGIAFRIKALLGVAREGRHAA